MRGQGGHRGESRSGVTLVELLVSLGVIAVLAGALLVGLRFSRIAARTSASLANLRTHAQAFTTYTSDYAGVWPLLVAPRAADGQPMDVVYYAAQEDLWPGWMRAYYEGGWYGEAFYAPEVWADLENRSPGHTTSYMYGAAFVARPEYWNKRTRTGPEQWGATRASEVSHPSAKALHNYRVWSRVAGGLTVDGLGNQAQLSFVDGSAAEFDVREINKDYGGFGAGENQREWHPLAIASYTYDGVRGRDVDGR